jgi:hypothetical protein
MVAFRPLWLPVLLLACLSACKKDLDEVPPDVSIVLPGTGYTVSVPDTLLVRVEVGDDRQLESLTISLNDADGVPISPPVVAMLNSVSTTVTRELVLTSERLISGNYSLTVTATDGVNESRAFRTITVQAAPLRLRSLYVTPPFGFPAPIPVWRIDSTGSLSQVATLSELGGAAIDPDRLYLAGSELQPLLGIPQVSGAASVSVQNGNSAGATVPFFLGVSIDPGDGRCYFGTNDGFVRGLNNVGTQVFTAQSPSGFRSERTATVGNVLASFARHQVLGQWSLVSHALASGAVLGQFPADQVPVVLWERNAQQALVFGNRNGIGVVQECNVQQGGCNDLRTFNEGEILAVARLDASNAIIAVPGNLVRYSAGSNSVTLLAQGTTAQCLAYDAATGTLYAGVGNDLVALDPMTGAQSILRTFPHSVGAVLPLLNR